MRQQTIIDPPHVHCVNLTVVASRAHGKVESTVAIGCGCLSADIQTLSPRSNTLLQPTMVKCGVWLPRRRRRNTNLAKISRHIHKPRPYKMYTRWLYMWIFYIYFYFIFYFFYTCACTRNLNNLVHDRKEFQFRVNIIFLTLKYLLKQFSTF